MPGITKKEAERLATIEEWLRNHENQHNTKHTLTIALITGAIALAAAFGAAGLTALLTK